MEISKWVVAAVSALLFGMIGYLAYSNSSSFLDKDAATVFPFESKNIVMAKETVRIKPAERK